MLELGTEGKRHISCDIQSICGKIAYALESPSLVSPGNIKLSERNVIFAFLDAWWRFELVRLPEADDHRGATVLESVGCARSEISPYLKAWEDAEGEAAAVRLALVVNSCAKRLYKSRDVSLVYWSDKPRCATQLADWFATAPPRQILERAILRGVSGAVESEMSHAFSVLEFLAKPD